MVTIDILIPTYNGASYIRDTIKSILSQSFKDFQIIICDDASTDNTIKLIKKIPDKRITIKTNKKNLGYSRNLERARKYATAEFIYLMGQDDIMAKDALLNTINAFKISPDIGAVTRPYYWFDKDIKIPVRAKKQLNSKKDTVVSIFDNPEKVIRVFETLDQLSGLSFRTSFMNIPFHPDVFPCHIYPFADIFKNHPIVFLKDYNIAVRIASSQTRTVSSIYNKSPLLSWIEMVKSIFSEEKYKEIQKFLINDFITKNYIGLVQLRNYAKFKYFLREIWYLIVFNYHNLISFKFWFYSLGTFITPSFILIPLVDWYKNKINSKPLAYLIFKYKI